MSAVRVQAKKSKAMVLAGFAGTTAALALVIWIKLRVVTTIPKQAYADPEVRAHEPRVDDARVEKRENAR